MTSSDVAIVGCGAHARKVAQAVMRSGGVVTVFMDERADAQPPLPGFTAEVLGRSPRGGSEPVIVAIGDEKSRRRITADLLISGRSLGSVVHPQAYVSVDASLGRGVVVLAGAIVESGARIGDGAIVDVGAIVDHDASVAEFSHVRPGCVVPAYGRWPNPVAGEHVTESGTKQP